MITDKPKPKELIIEKHDKHYYRVSIKDTKYYSEDTDIYTTIGKLVFNHQDVFNVKIDVRSKKNDTIKKKKGGLLFNTNPGSSLGG